MGASEEILRMIENGSGDQEVVSVMRSRGYPESEVYEGLSQAKIKRAVSAGGQIGVGKPQDPYSIPVPSYAHEEQSIRGELSGGDSFRQNLTPNGMQMANVEGMQPSMMAPQQETQQIYEPQTPPSQSAVEEEYVGEPYGGGYSGNVQGPPVQGQAGVPEYQMYQEGMSSDVIAEIAEQVVSEKLSSMQDKIDRAIDFKTIAEARLIGLDRRLRRIEQIIDRLQLSVLQKIGNYVNDVQDIKKELVETQKSFQAIHHGRIHHSTHAHDTSTQTHTHHARHSAQTHHPVHHVRHTRATHGRKSHGTHTTKHKPKSRSAKKRSP